MTQVKGLKLFSIKEAEERSLNDLKVNKVCMLVFNIINSCCMVASNMDHDSILRSMIKGKESPPMKGCRKAWVILNEINIILPHMEYEVIDSNRTLIGSS